MSKCNPDNCRSVDSIIERRGGTEMKEVLKDKVALVTGGASGIGRATALVFAREGASVLVADVNIEGGENTAQLIKEIGANAIFIKCDVAKAADVEAMVKKAVDTYGRLDCAFNNAGVGVIKSTVDCTEEEWDQVISVNLKGVWLCMKYEIIQMLKQGNGTIVNTSSIFGLIGTQNYAPYAASKHGIIGLTKAAALDCAQAGIRVNAVCPGGVITPMFAPILADPEVKDAVQKMHPLGRFGKPEEIAEAVLWLCSDAASFVTGAALPIDGGVVVGK
jgi:NAD(P)-dependent dehydrogenase (short-subunit alcohol dehydrogenase family)